MNLTLVQLLLSIVILLYHAPALSSFPCSSIPGHAAFFGSMGERLGSWCVDGFLVLSGYMLSRSAAVGAGGFREAVAFSIKRLCRIFPGVFFAALIAVFAVGPAFTVIGSCGDYFRHPATWDYLLDSLNLFARPPLSLPGVFDSNAYGPVVNGSLWMIPWLMWCYVLFAVALLFRLHANPIAVASLWVLSLCARTMEHDIDPAAMFGGLWAHDGMRLLGAFVTGWAFHVFRDRILLDGCLAVVVLAAAPFWFRSDAHAPASCLIAGYVLCTFCFHVPPIPRLAWLPQIYWEIYLLAFMVQQCVTAAHGGAMSAKLNFVYSLLVTIPLATVLHLLVDWTSRTLRKHLLSLVVRQQETKT